jgi:cell division control protein 12
MSSGSVIGITNLPNQYHKIISRKTINFTILLVGASGSGKTTFINTLFNTDLKGPSFPSLTEKTLKMDINRFELEEKGFKIRLTIIDTPGFGDFVNNQSCWESVVSFIDLQYEDFLENELQTKRKVADYDDVRIHACLYFISPTGHSLSPLDVKAMKELGSRVNLIPVVAKADTLTADEIMGFKERVI